MPIVPNPITQSVLPSTSAGTPYQQINATPDAFGAQIGAAEQRVGAAGVQLGGTLADIEIRNQQLANKVAVQAAFNQNQDENLKLLDGDPANPEEKGFLAKQGQAAMSAYPGLRDALDKSRTQRLASLPNDAAKLEFDDISRRYNYSTLERASHHYNREAAANAVQTFSQAIGIKAQAVAGDYLNEAEFQHQLADTDRVADFLTTAKGASPDSALGKQNRTDASRELYTVRAERWAATDPVGALAFVKANEGKFDPKIATRLLEKYQPKADHVQGKSVSDQAWNAIAGRGATAVDTTLPPEAQQFLPALAGGESKGYTDKNPTSSASGRYQFLDSTWSEVAGDAGGDVSQPAGAHPPGVQDKAAWNYATDTYKKKTGGNLQADIAAGGNDEKIATALNGVWPSLPGGSQQNTDMATWKARLAAGKSSPSFVVGKPEGLIAPGNLDLNNRPVVHNDDGSISTVRSMTITTDQGAILLPTVIGNRVVSNKDAIAHWEKTGENLGTFSTIDQADAYARNLHESQAQRYVQPSGPLYPDVPALAKDIIARTEGMSPEVRHAALSDMEQKVSVYRLQVANRRASVEKSIADIKLKLEDGHADTEIPVSDIRATMPPEQAAAALEELNIAKGAGLVFAGIKLGTPDEIAAAREDLSTGQGVRSTMIRLKHNQAMGLPDSTAEAPDNYGTRQKILARFNAMVADRDKAMNTDGAGYAVAASDDIRTMYLSRDPAKPETVQAYAQAALNAQGVIGVKEQNQSVIPKQEASEIVSKIHRSDPEHTNVQADLAGMARQYGDYWPKAFGDLVKSGLSGEYQVLTTMDRPEQSGAAADLQNMLAFKTKKGGMKEVEEAMKDSVKDVKDSIPDALAPFRTTVANNAGGAELFGHVENAVKLLAYQYVMRGDGGSDAVRKAVDGVIGLKYEMKGTWRAPKDIADDASVAAVDAARHIKMEDLAPVQGNTLLSDPERGTAMISAIKSTGAWVNNADDSGIVYTYLAQGRRQPVMMKNGTPMQIKWNAIPKVAAPTVEQPTGAGLAGMGLN